MYLTEKRERIRLRATFIFIFKKIYIFTWEERVDKVVGNFFIIFYIFLFLPDREEGADKVVGKLGFERRLRAVGCNWWLCWWDILHKNVTFLVVLSFWLFVFLSFYIFVFVLSGATGHCVGEISCTKLCYIILNILQKSDEISCTKLS